LFPNFCKVTCSNFQADVKVCFSYLASVPVIFCFILYDIFALPISQYAGSLKDLFRSAIEFALVIYGRRMFAGVILTSVKPVAIFIGLLWLCV